MLVLTYPGQTWKALTFASLGWFETRVKGSKVALTTTSPPNTEPGCSPMVHDPATR